MEDKSRMSSEMIAMQQEIDKLRNELSMYHEYQEAYYSKAIARYKLNLTKNIIEDEIVLETENGPYKLMESLGLKPPCGINELFAPLVEKNLEPEYQYWSAKTFDRDVMLQMYHEGFKEDAFEYKRTENAPGPRYLRQHILMARDPVSGDIIGIGNTKDVTNRYRMQGNITRKNENITHAALINSLSELYYFTYYIEVKYRSFIPLSVPEKIRTFVVGYKKIQDALYGMCEELLKREHCPDAREFVTLDTLPERMDQANYISAEFETNEVGWVRASFIRADSLENGEVASVVLAVQEINKEKEEQLKTQKILENALNRAEAASKSKTEFLFNMSHDIRTPMNAILGYTNIGLRHNDDQKRTRDSFQKIKLAGGHLLNLINDILEMSRIKSGTLELAENPTDIRQAIEAVDHMSQALALPKDIEFKTVMGEIRDPYLYSDELHMNEVVINLISNAVKYTRPGGRVTYSVHQISGVIDGKATFRLEVTDNGIGMSEEFQRHLFEAFVRESNSTVSKTEGAGLGLSIVKKIVDLAGGTIRVRSRTNEGSTFTVEVPFRVMDDAAIEAFRAEMNARSSNSSGVDILLDGKKVLLVEDNEMNREIATDLLTEAGLYVDTAEDGELAVKAFLDNGKHFYDFILMDIQMPVMNGYEAAKAIRMLPGGKHIPIIALSANAFEEDREKSLSVGMNDHLSKPIDNEKLIECLKKYI